MKNDCFASGCAILLALAGLVSVAETGDTTLTWWEALSTVRIALSALLWTPAGRWRSTGA